MNEKEFQKRIHWSIVEWGKRNTAIPHYRKLRDDGLIQPYDAIACLPGGKFVAFEYKVNRLKGKINFNDLFSKGRIHQAKTLDWVSVLGGIAWVLVAWKRDGRWECHAFSPFVCLELEKGKSADMDMLEREGACLRLDPMPGGKWDLSPLFGS